AARAGDRLPMEVAVYAFAEDADRLRRPVGERPDEDPVEARPALAIEALDECRQQPRLSRAGRGDELDDPGVVTPLQGPRQVVRGPRAIGIPKVLAPRQREPSARGSIRRLAAVKPAATGWNPFEFRPFGVPPVFGPTRGGIRSSVRRAAAVR